MGFQMVFYVLLFEFFVTQGTFFTCRETVSIDSVVEKVIVQHFVTEHAFDFVSNDFIFLLMRLPAVICELVPSLQLSLAETQVQSGVSRFMYFQTVFIDQFLGALITFKNQIFFWNIFVQEV